MASSVAIQTNLMKIRNFGFVLSLHLFYRLLHRFVFGVFMIFNELLHVSHTFLKFVGILKALVDIHDFYVQFSLIFNVLFV